jgi:hypothetical protein
VCLGEVERVLALLGGHVQLGAHHLEGRVLGQLEVVDTRHHRRQEVVRVHVRLERFAHHRQRRVQTFEA